MSHASIAPARPNSQSSAPLQQPSATIAQQQGSGAASPPMAHAPAASPVLGQHQAASPNAMLVAPNPSPAVPAAATTPPMPARMAEMGEPTGLHRQRPQWLTEAIDTQFSELVGRSGRGYLYTGNTSDYGFFPGVSAAQVCQHLVSQREDIEGSVRVLDIGCGSGLFQQSVEKRNKGRVEAFGISAEDMRAKKSADPRYIVGCNAEHLCDAPAYPGGTFDLIVSKMTFMHLIDPLGALSHAYEALAPGGILMVDEFPLPGLHGKVAPLMESLRNEGYELAYTTLDRLIPNGRLHSLVIRKTQPQLTIPVAYQQLDDKKRVVYAAAASMESSESTVPEALQPRAQQIAYACGPRFYAMERFGTRGGQPDPELVHFLAAWEQEQARGLHAFADVTGVAPKCIPWLEGLRAHDGDAAATYWLKGFAREKRRGFSAEPW